MIEEIMGGEISAFHRDLSSKINRIKRLLEYDEDMVLSSSAKWERIEIEVDYIRKVLDWFQKYAYKSVRQGEVKT